MSSTLLDLQQAKRQTDTQAGLEADIRKLKGGFLHLSIAYQPKKKYQTSLLLFTSTQ
jgi:hypothetical protein